MSDRTFTWLFVWVAATFGWAVRIVHVEHGQLWASWIAVLGGGALCAWLGHRLSRHGDS